MQLLHQLASRFPHRNDLKSAFLVCAFPVAIWSWIIFIYDVPSFLHNLRVDQIASVFAYVQVVALIESILLFAMLTLLAVLLPRIAFLDNYLPQVAITALALAFWAIGVHLHDEQIALGSLSKNQSLLVIWTIVWIVIFLTLSILARFKSKANSLLLSLVDRMAFVSGIYLFFAIISLPVVILRNLALAIF